MYPKVNLYKVLTNGRLLIGFLKVYHGESPLSHPKRLKDYNKHDYIHYYVMRPNGQVAGKQILKLKRRRIIFYKFRGGAGHTSLRNIFGKPLLAITGDGKTIAAAYSKNSRIKIYRPDGTIKGIIQYDFKKVPLSRKALISNKNFHTFIPMETVNLPATWPVLHYMLFDSKNRLWVATVVPNFNVYRWYIFNLNGKLLGRFTWPRDAYIQTVKNGYMYAVKENSNAPRRIVKYKIKMTPIGQVNTNQLSVKNK